MPRDQYRALYEGFRWDVPREFNIARHVLRALGGRALALRASWEDESGETCAATPTGTLQREANRLSNALAALGVARGDRVALILPQRPETAVAHIAVYQMGAVAVPLSFLFGPDALEYRLGDSRRRVAIVDPQSLPNLAAVCASACPACAHVIGVAGAREACGRRRGSRCSNRAARRSQPVAHAARAIRRSSSTRAARPARRRAR